MLFKDISLINENFELEEHRYVAIEGDTIVSISDEMPEKDFGEVYDGTGKLLIPAFYNAHSHLPMAYLRGYGENLALMDWLQGRIFPFEAQMTAEDIYYGTLYGVAEMLRYGIGSTTEMYIMQEPLGKAFLDCGVKTNFCVSTVWFGPEAFNETHYYQEAMASLKDFHLADNGRLRSEFCLHAEYTNTERIAFGVAEAAAANNCSMQVHVSETRSEVEQCRERHQGKSPVQYLAECGIFDVPTTAAHCVHIDEQDIAILKAKNVSVATCPKSNAKLSSGICPVTSLLEAGVNVALGTDSVASNNNLNMIEEMRFFNLLQKARTYDPTVITPAQTLYAATRAGALSQQRPDCGLIKEGFKADLTVFDIDKPYMRPVHNLLNNLIYSTSGTDVVLTMVDGKILYQDGTYPTLDLERIEFEVEQRRQRILGALA